MQVTKQTASYVHQLAAYTGNVADGKPEQRSSVPAQHQRSLNSVLAKCLALVEAALKPDQMPEGDDQAPEWVPFSKDFKVPEGKRIVDERWTGGELELTPTEREFVKWCAKQRDQLPVADDATLDEFEALTEAA